jgi:hypothetical protein
VALNVISTEIIECVGRYGIGKQTETEKYFHHLGLPLLLAADYRG